MSWIWRAALGLAVCYLAIYVALVLVRLLTGVSISRVGYFSLRHIGYNATPTLFIEIGRIGVRMHRPTFSRGTWLTLSVSNAIFTLREQASSASQSGGSSPNKPRMVKLRNAALMFQRILHLLHEHVVALGWIDIEVLNTTLDIVDHGKLSFGSIAFSLADVNNNVATGPKTTDPLLRRIGWSTYFKNAVFETENCQAQQLFDHMVVVFSGRMDSSKKVGKIFLRFHLGKVYVPYDDMHDLFSNYQQQSRKSPLTPLMTGDGQLVENCKDIRDFAAWVLRGVQEIQLHAGYFSMKKLIPSPQPSGSPLYAKIGIKEPSLDLSRLSPKSPTHRMHFQPGTMAHRVFITAISVAVSLDDGKSIQDTIMNIPMATLTSRTTLFPHEEEHASVDIERDKNANLVSGSILLSEPSLDIKPQHIPLILAMLSQHHSRKDGFHVARGPSLLEMLPKIDVKISVQEPSIRILLPPAEGEDEITAPMLVSSFNGMAINVNSSHSSLLSSRSQYHLIASLVLENHVSFYRSFKSENHNLLSFSSLRLKVGLQTCPEIQIEASAYSEAFTVELTRQEIITGLREMFSQLRKDVEPTNLSQPKTVPRESFLRRIPGWLQHFKFDAVDSSIRVAGVDEMFAKDARGVALNVQSWGLEYHSFVFEKNEKGHLRKKFASREPSGELLSPLSGAIASPFSPQPSSGWDRRDSPFPDLTDGRSLKFTFNDLESFVIQNVEEFDAEEPVAIIPSITLAFATCTDRSGPAIRCISDVKEALLAYSLTKHYVILLAVNVIRDSFGGFVKQHPKPESSSAPDGIDFFTSFENKSPDTEFWIFDFKVNNLRVKAHLSDDPALMLEFVKLELERQRWGVPVLRAKFLRLFVASPTVGSAWQRLFSIRHAKIDVKKSAVRANKPTDIPSYISLHSEAIRIRVAHKLIVHKVFDNIVNSAKAVQQLQYRHRTRSNDYILDQHAKEPKSFPPFRVRTRNLCMDIEDDPFESRLGLIFRVGLAEVRVRLAREATFEAKLEKIKEAHSETSRESSIHPNDAKISSSEADYESSEYSRPDQFRRGSMRYSPLKAREPSASCCIDPSSAYKRLLEHNSEAWIRRVRVATKFQAESIIKLRQRYMEDDQTVQTSIPERFVGIPNRPSLFAFVLHDFELKVDKPSFSRSELPKFVHDRGKGLPMDTKFTLLIPMNVKLGFEEGRVQLRDYPLPLIHIPPMHPSQKQNVSSFQLQTDLVIAEELRGSESDRDINVCVVPRNYAQQGSPPFCIDVRRSVSPIKTYSDVSININTAWPTHIMWGQSLQPAIQDTMQRFESFTKPQVDMSEKLGFWDKIRLILHTRVRVAWQGDGDVHLTLKGSRDPYVVTDEGCGFVMCWRGNVLWDISCHEDQRRFTEVDSEEFLLAIPDFTKHAAQFTSGNATHAIDFRRDAAFRKVLMKLSGNVKWQVGLLFQQSIKNLDSSRGSFHFKNHFEVVLKNPQYAHDSEGRQYDAFRGFRSQHLHLSISVMSPRNREWTSTDRKASDDSYNTIHLTPMTIYHFFTWWKLFSGPLSLPIRHGVLFPSPEKSAKKFGRHLATVKYKLLLSPLFLSHVYKHRSVEDRENKRQSFVGLKAKLGMFSMDLHQRRENKVTTIKQLNASRKMLHMRMHKGEVDLDSADIRAVSAKFDEPTLEELVSPESTKKLHDERMLSGFVKIPDDDLSWVDMDDFVELDSAAQVGINPTIKILPMVYTPRFTYLRQTDPSAGGQQQPSPFGEEDSHFCSMSTANDPLRAQLALVIARAKFVDQLINETQASLRELEKSSKNIDTRGPSKILKQRGETREHDRILREKRKVLQAMLHTLVERTKISQSVHDDPELANDVECLCDYLKGVVDGKLHLDLASWTSDSAEFNNRFIVHNMQAKWNNSLRNIILLYIHQVTRRRGYIYYMSRKAVRFIIDLVNDQESSPRDGSTSEANESTKNQKKDKCKEDAAETLIRQLLDDAAKRFVVADDTNQRPPSSQTEEVPVERSAANLTKDIHEDYVPLSSYHVRLVAPQIQFQSEKNRDTVAILATQSMELKVVSVMDKDMISDDVSGLVQRRFAVNLDDAQFFTAMRKDFAPITNKLFSANSYGVAAGSFWPSWVPLESMYDSSGDSGLFRRIIDRTSAVLLYEKHNSLRLKYDEHLVRKPATYLEGVELGGDQQNLDHCSVEFKKVTATCNSMQYFAMLVIVLDLLMYSEPLQKQQSERLERIMLTSDFSDLGGAPRMVAKLQRRIQQLMEIRLQFDLTAETLDEQGWRDRRALEEEIEEAAEELFYIMKAITSSQGKVEEKDSQTTAVLRWFLAAREVSWQLLQGDNSPLVDLGLNNATYQRIDNSDGSNFNTLEIELLKGRNLLPDAVYPELIGPYLADNGIVTDLFSSKIIRVYWYMLEAIGGIPVMDHFEVNMFPLKIQLEREVGKRIFEYVFPRSSANDLDNGTFLPFNISNLMDSNNENNEERNAEAIDTLTKRMEDDPEGMNDLRTRMQPTLGLVSQEPAAFTKGKGLTRRNTKSEISLRSHLKRSHHHVHQEYQSRSALNSEASSLSSKQTEPRHRLNTLRRINSEDDGPRQNDELNQMIKRASNYLTLVYVKVPGVKLCLSYKGKGARNFEDVHEFVFSIPTIEYRNKTWSHVDLALHLKKEIIRALISHAGALIENKITHHRPKDPSLRSKSSMYSLDSASGSTQNLDVNKKGAHDLYNAQVANGRSNGSTKFQPTLQRVSQATQPESVDGESNDGSRGSMQSGDGESEKEEHSNQGAFANVLTKHLSSSSPASRYRESHNGDNEDSMLKKSRLLLGKKLLRK